MSPERAGLGGFEGPYYNMISFRVQFRALVRSVIAPLSMQNPGGNAL